MKYEKFDILDIAFITDNGSNFFKAFFVPILYLYGSTSKHQMITPTVNTVPAPAMTVRARISSANKSHRLVCNIDKFQFCINICDWRIAHLIGSRRCWYIKCVWREKFWIWRNRRRLGWYRWWPCGWRPRGSRKERRGPSWWGTRTPRIRYIRPNYLLWNVTRRRAGGQKEEREQTKAEDSFTCKRNESQVFVIFVSVFGQEIKPGNSASSTRVGYYSSSLLSKQSAYFTLFLWWTF